MGRCNGIFRYRNSQEPVRNASTGFYEEAQEEQDGWTEPCQCQIDRYAPAKQYVGTDGQTHSYTYNLYVMQPFNCDALTIGTEVEITLCIRLLVGLIVAIATTSEVWRISEAH